jgi:hypothetical protein
MAEKFAHDVAFSTAAAGVFITSGVFLATVAARELGIRSDALAIIKGLLNRRTPLPGLPSIEFDMAKDLPSEG